MCVWKGKKIKTLSSSTVNSVSLNNVFIWLGVTGFEPATSRPPAERATKLRHTPYSALLLYQIYLKNQWKFSIIIKIKETHESVRVLWYNGRIAGIILRINGFCVHCRNPALISVGSTFLRDSGIISYENIIPERRIHHDQFWPWHDSPGPQYREDYTKCAGSDWYTPKKT